MGTNTGTGGFDIDGKTYEFDVGDPKAPGIKPIPTDHGDVHVDHFEKDVSKSTKETLSQYLSDATQQNDEPVDAEYVDASLSTTHGVPTPIGETKNSARYADRKSLEYPTERSSQLSFGTPLIEKFKDPVNELDISKGHTYPQHPNGNSILKNVTPDKLGSIEGYTNVVLSNNRFTAASKAAATNVRDPNKDFDPSFIHPRYGTVKAGQLAQVGIALSLRASQELNASKAGNDPSGGPQEEHALLPGFNQLGASRVNTHILEARDVLETLTRDEVPGFADARGGGSNLTSITEGGSWGAMNNVDDPFSGITALGMIALAAALTAAIVVLFEGLGFILSMIHGGSDTRATRNPAGRYALGRYVLSPGPNPNQFPPSGFPPDLGAMLGIQPTIHPFSAALQAGVAAFFGIDTSGGIFGQLTSGLTSASENPGFNAVVARTIVRSSITVVDAFKHVGGSSNIVAGFKNILGVIDTIRKSKLIGAMNVFSVIGDQVLNDELRDETVTEGQLPGEPVKKSLIDNLDDNAGAVAKNRLRGYDNQLKLAWSSNRAPASYLVPDALAAFSVTSGHLGAFQIGIGQHSAASRTFYNVLKLGNDVKSAARIPYDSPDPNAITVKSMENLLEGEYMPFYFHDLRTNEIISFHAFISELTEEYSPQWESSEGYGRVDQVKTYKNTQRKITLTFFVVATSNEDFKDMWQKVNKLVTLVYPQYSKGRELSDATNQNSFIQPFSQIMTASPLIRLRIGDLLRSNYSRFGLARLFGADSNAITQNGSKISFENSVSGIEKLQGVLKRQLESPMFAEFLLNVNDLPQETTKGQISVSLPSPLGGSSSGDSPKHAPRFHVLLDAMPYIVFTVKSILQNDNVVVVPRLMTAPEISETYGYSSKASQDRLRALSAEIDNQAKPIKRVIGGSYVAHKGWLRLTAKEVHRVINDVFPDASTNADKVATLMSADKNAIVKAFQSAQGKGLAGTIDSMSFNWTEDITWEISPNERAPKMCRISMGFTPIHDISPGLDHNGYNRAPVYPVGFAAPGNDDEGRGN